MKQGTLKQILLLTDGCSNQGEDPIATAALAFEQGITVNVVGILDDSDRESSNGLKEVEGIATSGGGVSEIVYKESLSQTVQTVTKQAMNQTLQGFIHQELTHILGEEQTISDLDPKKRGEVMEVVEEIGETCDLEVLVLVDTSASMNDKIEVVKEALIDLSISLNARIGENRFSIFQFPGKRKYIQKLFGWSPRLDSISSVFPKLLSGGITPTGPALKEAIAHFGKKGLLRSLRGNDEQDIEKAWG